MERLGYWMYLCDSQGNHMKLQITGLMLGDYDLLNIGWE